MSQCWKCTLGTSVFGPISQSAVAKCLSCSNKCLFFGKLWRENILFLLLEKTCWTLFSNFKKQTELPNIQHFSNLLFAQVQQKRNSPPSLPTMASKVDSRLIKSVVFRPAPQWRAADRVTICHLGEATKTALTISLDPPWTQSTRTSRCLNTCSAFKSFPLFFVHFFLSNVYLTLIGCFVWMIYSGYQFYF